LKRREKEMVVLVTNGYKCRAVGLRLEAAEEVGEEKEDSSE
jgi:hypothetical protein